MSDEKPFEYKYKGDKLIVVIDTEGLSESRKESLLKSLEFMINHELRMGYIEKVLQKE